MLSRPFQYAEKAAKAAFSDDSFSLMNNAVAVFYTVRKQFMVY
jgi:hypothetical protein